MDDQVLVRVGDRLTDLEEEPQAFLERGGAGAAPVDHGLPLDVLHHRIWLAGGGDASVEEAGDARVLQASEDLTLDLEPLEQGDRVLPEELDGGALLELTVGALGLVHFAHAAAADEPQHAPRTEPRARAERLDGATHHHHGSREEIAAAVRSGEQSQKLGEHRAIERDPLQRRSPRSSRQVDGLGEERLDLRPLRG